MREDSELRLEYLEDQRRKRKQSLEDPRAKAALKRQAMVVEKVRSLQATPEWEWFLSWVEESRLLCIQRRQSAYEMLSADSLTPEQLHRQREIAMMEQTRILLLDHILQLPEKLIRDGESALEHLHEVEDSA